MRPDQPGDSCYDVIVAGAGPGGATAAYYLGQAGLRVVVLEKDRLPRYKTCGGGISAHLLEQFPFSFSPVIESRIRAVTYALGRRTVTLSLPEGKIHMVMRAQFDAHLLAHARARVYPGTPIQTVIETGDEVIVHARDGRVFRAPYLVAADGANSIAARSLGLRAVRTLAGAIEVEAPVPASTFEGYRDHAVFIFGEISNGYLWIFPKSDHLSVGIAALRPQPGELQATLRRVMATYGIGLDGLKLHGHPIPIYLRRERIATHRTLLVGDAAGLVDPFNGEGIRFAVKSGRMAAEAILSGQPESYPGRIWRQIGAGHRVALGLALLFYRFPRACFTLGVRNPFVTYAFIELMADRSSYAQLFLRMFGTLPIFLATEALATLAGRLSGPELSRRLRAAVYPNVPG